MGCLTWLILIVGVIFVMVTLLRWFEQTADAVDLRWWNMVFVLVVMPFTVWLFPARVSAGRPTPVPLHEPVRGFGSVPKGPGGSGQALAAGAPDRPPPGTPKEFLEKPKIPPKPKGKKPGGASQDQVEKLRRKMMEQGMLDDQEKPGRE